MRIVTKESGRLRTLSMGMRLLSHRNMMPANTRLDQNTHTVMYAMPIESQLGGWVGSEYRFIMTGIDNTLGGAQEKIQPDSARTGAILYISF
jgi:hypothetical protein